MRRQTTLRTRKVPILVKADNYAEPLPAILADSLEVMENYYRGKIQVLENSLTGLTLLDNAREITTLCKEISHTKAELRKVFLRKKI